MRIAILASNPGTGLLFYPVRLAVMFRQLGYDVCAYTWSDCGQTPGLADQLRESGVEIAYRSELKYTGLRGFLASVWHMISRSDERPVDLLLTYGPMGAWQLRRVVGENGVRVAMIESMGHDGRSYWKPLIGATLLNRYCDKVGALCNLELLRLRRAGVMADKLVVIHNPVDWRRLSEINVDRGRVLSEFGLSAERRYMGCMAVFQPRKRQDLLLRAFAAVAQEFEDVELVFCGDGAELPALRQLTARLGLDHRVHFTGRISNAECILLTASLDAFALLSNAETFGYSFVEPIVLPFRKLWVGAESAVS